MIAICAVFSAKTGLDPNQKRKHSAKKLLRTNSLGSINLGYINSSVEPQLTNCPSVLQLVQIRIAQFIIDVIPKITCFLKNSWF
jgi:hypothetical protein